MFLFFQHFKLVILLLFIFSFYIKIQLHINFMFFFLKRAPEVVYVSGPTKPRSASAYPSFIH